MLFSSLTFLYIFLPIVLILYYLINKEYRNHLLFAVSFIFFAWGGVSYSALLIISILMNYFFGRAIAFYKSKRFFLGLGIGINLLFLGVFKYTGFITESINTLLGIAHYDPFGIPKIVLPIGISFYTFQAVSYLIDLYRKETQVQMSVSNMGLFISFFPQLIAGPIVRYHDIATQIDNRDHNSLKFSQGVLRFALGLAKKVLIANNLAIIADQVFATPTAELTTLASWVGIIAYTFQIYYDFAGYSDMAIGLARMFGFELLENFNFPYISRSIQEFWKRWHISLSSWFRDYLYIPLGGNRISVKRTYINLFIVFFITGLWHGSSWNFVAWGLIHGFFIIIERIGFNRVLQKIPNFFSGFYTFFIAVMAWVMFRSESVSIAGDYYKALFGFAQSSQQDIKLLLVINPEFIFSFVIAIFGAFGGFIGIQKLASKVWPIKPDWFIQLKTIGYVLFLIVTMVLTTTYLANSTYNPFIYFRF